ncbi:hypothetical protein PR202_ga13545 [Eleusine coracana subsp. coracana]|uniref:Uncharacterized protein n=1 Tax=Eleusine coracana subsp. coracana TaxID=191504 RepID=A0AAV5CEE2_ELECO|nr:hypothetical protein PR202_ga13545 [Eleusine coracana subsp. coracana]
MQHYKFLVSRKWSKAVPRHLLILIVLCCDLCLLSPCPLLLIFLILLVLFLCFAFCLLLLGRSQLLHQTFEARLHIVVDALHCQVLGHVRRRHVRLLQQLTDGVEQLVGLDAEVHPGQEFEGLEAAVGHLDVLVHASPPDECRVQLLDVVGGEDDDPLAAARRPEPVDEVEQAGQRHLASGARRVLLLLVLVLGVLLRFSLLFLLVLVARAGEVQRAVDVLDDDDGLAGGLDEEAAEVGVGVDRRELDVVDVVAEVVGHGGDHGRLSRPRRAVQEVPALPRLADARVILLPVPERVKVGDDVSLLHGVHGERGESLGVLERDVAPRPAGEVGEELPLPVPDHGLAPLAPHVREVGVEDQVPVPVEEEEAVEAAVLLRGGAPPREPVGARRRLGVGGPPHPGALEVVGDLLPVGHAEHQLVGVVVLAAAAGLGAEVAHAAAGV